MTPTLAKDSSAEELERNWTNEDPGDPVEFSEDTVHSQSASESSAFPTPFPTARVAQLPKALGEAISDEHAPGPIRFRMSPGGSSPTNDSPLRASFMALGGIRSSRLTADWIEAAATLKRDATRLRNTSYARHSSVLLALADALTFTDPSDPALNVETATVDRGLALLSEPFVRESEEETFLTDLLSQGWNLAPAGSDEPLGE